MAKITPTGRRLIIRDFPDESSRVLFSFDSRNTDEKHFTQKSLEQALVRSQNILSNQRILKASMKHHKRQLWCCQYRGSNKSANR
jgi:hypothetical protein